ncbi:MAG: hypothetical protein H0T42_21695 [Deltaproteobacteria bacterium]|nr:hypothetical protein [Deltaproteobacteria bacterium]
MAGTPKEKLQTQAVTEEAIDEREVFLRDGRKLVLSEQGNDQLVEIRSESGLLELRIKLTEQGPVLQMESVRLQLKATEAVEIESQRIEIKGTERVDVTGGQIKVSGEEDVNVDAKGEVRVVGKMIYLN